MNKKQSILVTLILLLTSLLAYADLKTYDVDLDNDGKDEFVAVYETYELPEDTLPFTTEYIVAVYKRPDVKKIGQFSMPDRFEKIEFVSLNKDGFKQIVAWSSGGAHYTNLAIYGYRDGKLYKIFENGSGCAILTDFNSTPPKIKVGIPKFKEKGWSYADEPNWEIWVWNDKKFAKR